MVQALLGCDVASLGIWFPTFGDILAMSSSKIKRSEMHHYIPEKLIPHFLPLLMLVNLANISFSVVTQILCHTV
jgi:hypothetical protein